MGRPEDLFDEGDEQYSNQETFTKKEENDEKNSSKKPLYRDIDEAYISGVSSGLGHYFEISTIWVRLAWVLLVFFSGGTFILLYLSLWFFVPEAKTTAEKLAMKGKSVNISNIEAKIKEGFNSVADTMKSAYHKNNGEEIKNKSVFVVSKLERFISQFFKILGRLLGLCLMFVSGLGIIALLAAFLGFNIMNFTDNFWFDYTEFTELGSPLWLSSVLVFLTAAIPLFFIFILGLKISFPHVKKIGRTVILSLIGAWLLSAIAVFIFQLSNGNINPATASVDKDEILNLSSSDTLNIVMRKKDRYIDQFNSSNDFLLRETIDGQKILVYRDIMIYVKTSKVKTPKIRIKKQANGSNYNEALELSKKIDYNYLIENNTLFLDAYALGNYEDKFKGQKVKIFLTLPENITLYADPSTRDYNNRRKKDQFVIIKNKEDHFLKLKRRKAICEDCLNDDSDDSDFEDSINSNEENDNLNFNGKSFNIKINDHGIQIHSSEENHN